MALNSWDGKVFRFTAMDLKHGFYPNAAQQPCVEYRSEHCLLHLKSGRIFASRKPEIGQRCQQSESPARAIPANALALVVLLGDILKVFCFIFNAQRRSLSKLGSARAPAGCFLVPLSH